MSLLRGDKVKYLIIAIALMSLTSCTKGSSNEDTKRLILPSVTEYSRNQQALLASELESGSCNISKEFITDYYIMREQTKVALTD